MALAVIVFSIIVGMLWGGRIERLINLNLQKVELVLLALILQYAVAFSATLGVPILLAYSEGILMLTYILLLVGLWFNRHIPSFWLVIIGVAMNALVILSNGGRMPVSPDALSAAGLDYYVPLLQRGNLLKHTLLTENTYFPWLADIIPLHKSFFPGGNVLSPGDIVLYLGVFFVIQRAMRKRKSRRKLPRHRKK